MTTRTRGSAVARLLSLLLLVGPAAVAPAADKPLKVFILAGQSNMQGHASVSTFDSLAGDPKTAPLLKDMLGPDGKPTVCEKVWITSVGGLGDAYSDLREAKGKLTAGFGAPENKIGPEFTFGLTVEKRLGGPVLIIKTAWGGRSLHTDFRPPGAGPESINAFTLEQWKKRGLDAEQETAKIHKNGGVFYKHMIDHVRKVLNDIARVVPGYDPKQGYELAGFVWFQGFNDYVDGWTYPDQNKPGGYDLYAELLGHLIRDVRKDLAAPKLPVVIGVMGIDGLTGDKKPPMMHFRAAQRKPASLDEFKGSVVAVETAPFWDDDLDALQQRWDRISNKLEQDFRKMDPKPSEKVKEEARTKAREAEFQLDERKRLKAGVSNGGYHYLGAAKILAPVGRAFAEALLNPPKPVGAANQPVKVFVLAGQSNMEGQGFIVADPKRNGGKGSLEFLVKDKATADTFKHLVAKDGKWIVRDDVWIHYLDRKGKLTVGYGAKDDRIGPELGFGTVVGDAFEEPVLLVKLAWGGKSLGKDFRPPSAGGEVGPYYKEIVDRTKAVLKNLKTEFPAFGDRGYDLAGFGWHQGWNDRVNQAFNDEYEKNLAHFIRDIRTDLGVKDLPFVIAETG
ncbi:sialate O-acetylesterase [Limnoglobus roseus]|uniref:Sialate O-acetylesterase n=1 Tax=Limnoglobus roseus TaxID=2598579 RepID=A0A5C1ARJ7_9BACT|nr:sialate O-acetylesterase [Limnoglobus roseus]QEL20777.1 sialate O-acetylesterase [Limnoglobus roseus]